MKSKFYMPTRVFEEKNAVLNHADEFKKFGTKALIVTGKESSKINGSLIDVCEALSSVGIGFTVFEDVEENPSIETIMKGRDFGVSEGVDFCIGIGGGSPLDAAKAIALMIKQKDSGYEYMYDGSLPTDALKVIAIPTTCGTGSEVTGVSVITVHEKKTKGSIKHLIFPEVAFVDGKYLKYAPVSVICNTAIDAYAHLVESYISTIATDYSRMCVHAGLKKWNENKEILNKMIAGESLSEDEYMELMRAAVFGGMAIAHTGTGLPHALSYSLTYNCGIKHGAACGYFLGGFLAAANKEDREYVLETSGFSSVDDYQAYFEKLCGKIKADRDVVLSSVETVAANQAKLDLTPFDVDRSIVEKIAFFGE